MTLFLPCVRFLPRAFSASSDSSADLSLTVPYRKPRTLKHLTVRLVGQYNIGWTDNTPYESGTCLERTVSLLNEGEEVQLERGEHTFEVSRLFANFSLCSS